MCPVLFGTWFYVRFYTVNLAEGMFLLFLWRLNVWGKHLQDRRIPLHLQIWSSSLNHTHCKWKASETPIKMSGSHLCIPRMKLLFPKQNYNVLSPSSYTHISVRYLYISRIGLPILLQENIFGTILGIYKLLTDTWMWKWGLRSHNSQKRNT
jgi:hypothetical protein